MSTATGDPAGDLHLIDATLANVGLARTAEPQALESGRNHNYRVPTGEGSVCVRIHRHTRSRERIELGLAALHHASRQGIPVAPPLAAADGSVLFTIEGRLTSAYQWVDVPSHERFAVTREGAAQIAGIHGRLHLALAGFHHPAIVPATELTWDPARSLRELETIAGVVRETGGQGFAPADILHDIAVQSAHIESGRQPAPTSFDWLPRQPIHGDVHEGNVLLAADGSVAAVIDWDMVALGPRLYELLRALDFTRALDDPASLDAYLAAYAATAPYPAAEAAAAVELWAASTICNTWTMRALFLEGDRRVEPFIPTHRERIRHFADPAYRAWLSARLAAFASE
jgi:Ser/Thr protein kinase RdoA (MazF antagonist)